MFRALIRPSSGAHDRSADYNKGRPVLGLLLVGSWVQAGYSLQSGYLSSLPAPNFQPTGTQERNDQCGNQHYSRELLMMNRVVPETC